MLGGEDHDQRRRPRRASTTRTWRSCALLAERGNGRFYLTDDATTLPQIFSTETMKVAQSSLVEEPFNPVPAAPSPLAAGHRLESLPAAARLQLHQAQAHRAGRARHRTRRTAAGHLALRPGADGRVHQRRQGALGRRMARRGTATGNSGRRSRAGLLRKGDQAAVPGPRDRTRRRQPAAAGHRRADARGRFPRPAAHRRDRAGHRHRPEPHRPRRADRAPAATAAEFDLPDARRRRRRAGGSRRRRCFRSVRPICSSGPTSSATRAAIRASFCARTRTKAFLRAHGRGGRGEVRARAGGGFRAAGAFFGATGGFDELFPCRRPDLAANRHLPAPPHLETAARTSAVVRPPVPASGDCSLSPLARFVPARPRPKENSFWSSK